MFARVRRSSAPVSSRPNGRYLPCVCRSHIQRSPCSAALTFTTEAILAEITSKEFIPIPSASLFTGRYDRTFDRNCREQIVNDEDHKHPSSGVVRRGCCRCHRLFCRLCVSLQRSSGRGSLLPANVEACHFQQKATQLELDLSLA